MKRIILFLTIFFIGHNVFSQAADFVVIRKNGINVRTFLKGGFARFINTSGNWIETRITDIRNDSIYFREVILQRVGTIGGGSRLDTVATPLRGIHYTEIAAVPRRKESFSYIKNGTLLMVGAGGFIVLNLVNGAYLHYPPFGKENRTGLMAAAGVFSFGYLLKKLHKPYLQIGKKYKLEYIKVAGPKH